MIVRPSSRNLRDQVRISSTDDLMSRRSSSFRLIRAAPCSHVFGNQTTRSRTRLNGESHPVRPDAGQSTEPCTKGDTWKEREPKLPAPQLCPHLTINIVRPCGNASVKPLKMRRQNVFASFTHHPEGGCTYSLHGFLPIRKITLALSRYGIV
ncbi:hypothetical protein BV22DRAFT_265373 [Leucogyrophana mollusca]|uniref:Uncharacterized protein n=1 Tax=Leucogyrophana mollusca TaxID=85980 RepID=A0ACB8BQX5_9AGAM|nr:hypothetical protein BV22DRAFT_265373 [Leucogyrophana mollusca]